MEYSEKKKPPAMPISKEDRFLLAFDQAREKISKRKSTLKSCSR